MKPVRKVAFVPGYWNGKIQQLLRGALRFADAHPPTLVRGFGSGGERAVGTVHSDALKAVSVWAPAGVLAAVDSAGMEQLLAALGPTPPPIVNCVATRRFDGVAEVVGSMPDLVGKAIEHFRHLGLRSLGFVSFDTHRVVPHLLRAVVRDLVGSAELGRIFLETPVEEEVLQSHHTEASSVPQHLARWMRDLPKPAGVLAIELGAGGYVIRVCKALGLRVPDDIAVIGGSDDADACLANDPTLTSVGVSGDSLGFEAMRVLDGMIAGEPAPEDAVRVRGVELHVRQSTGQRRAEICDIAAAKEYIRNNACRGIKVEEVVKATQGVSLMTFHKHFHSATGMTPGEAIRARQFDEARRLLAGTELSMSLVAEMSGFASSNDFARAFKVVEGKSPSDYRRENRR